MIEVVFKCGHRVSVKDDADKPKCEVCQERHIRRVYTRTPRFRGIGSGPHMKSEHLGGVPLDLAPGGRLSIKESHGRE